VSRNSKNLRARARCAGVVVGLGCAGGAACGRSTVLYEGDAYGPAVAAHGGSGGSSGRGGGAGKGGSSTSSTGGSVTTGGSGAVGGSVTGTGGSFAGSFGLAGSGGAVMGPYACAAVDATCSAFTEFPESPDVTWGYGAFTGGVTVFGPGITRAPGSAKLHVTGTVSDYSGVQIWFSRCSNLSAAMGIQMTITGTTVPPNHITFQPLTNSDYPWQPRPQDGKGACTAPDPLNPWLTCMAPQVEFEITGAPLLIAWNAFTGGNPVPWNPVVSPSEIVALQWLFPWSPGSMPYTVDLEIDDVFLVGPPGTDCVSAVGGTGGIGGGTGAAGGGARAGASGSSTAGSSFGGTGQAGSSNEAGAAGANEGGTGNDGGAPNGGAPDAGFGGI
jgi:hypothetical protein